MILQQSATTVREFSRNRGLLLELIRRDIKSRFAGARFGLLWSLFNPAIQLVSYGLIFGFLYGSADPLRRSVLVTSLFCGLFPWWAFQEGTMRGMSALVDQASLLKRIPLPPVLCILAATISSFLLQMIGFLLFLIAFGVIGLVTPSLAWLWLPVVMAAALALAVSLALLLAPLYLVLRDTLYVVTAAMTLGFFASPVLYELDFLPARFQPVAALNPLAGLLGLYRAVVIEAPMPSLASLVALGLGITLAWAFAMAFLRRLEGRLDEYW